LIYFKEEKQKELGRWTLGSATFQDYLFLLTLGTDLLVFPEDRRDKIRKAKSVIAYISHFIYILNPQT